MGFNKRLDGGLLDVGQHLEDDLPPSLEHAKNRGFLLLKGSATATAFQSAAASLASLGFDLLRLTFMPSHHIDFITFNLPR